MLVKFKFGNYRSFKETQTFSLVASKIVKNNERVFYADNLDLKLLKFSALYGANASGKTNFIRAAHFMKSVILYGCEGLSNQAFRLDDSCLKGDSYFEVFLLIGKEIYSYGFEVNFENSILTNEWLYKVFPGKEACVFDLDYSAGEGKISSNGLFDLETKKRLETYKNDLLPKKTVTFLNFISSLGKPLGGSGGEVINQVYDWFRFKLVVVSPYSKTTNWLRYSADKLDVLGKLMKSFDVGITKIERKKISEVEFLSSHSKAVLDDIKKDLANVSPNSGFVAQIGLEYWVIAKTEKDFSFEKLVFFHYGNEMVPFDVADESDGTNRMLSLIDILMTDQEDLTFFVDEVDRCLHPQMTCEFISRFLKKATSSSNQLIVTTHESHLLDLDILRHDEIWFANNEKGASSIYSLDDFNVRFDKKIGKAYLNGRFNGVPVFETLFPIGENNENKRQ